MMRTCMTLAALVALVLLPTQVFAQDATRPADYDLLMNLTQQLSPCERAVAFAWSGVLGPIDFAGEELPISGYPRTGPRAIYSQGGAHPNDPIMPGTSRVWPRTGPHSFDCSSLVWWSWTLAGKDVGVTTYQLQNNGWRLPCGADDLASEGCYQPGDLIFLKFPGGGQHVAMVLSPAPILLIADCYHHQRGCLIHADASLYREHFWQARRITACNIQGTGTTLWGYDIEPTISGIPTGEIIRFSDIPDFSDYVAYQMPSCAYCTEDGTTLIPDRVPPGNLRADRAAELLPTRADFIRDVDFLGVSVPYLDPLNAILKLLGWATFMLTQLLYDLICWLLIVMQHLINGLLLILNGILRALNYASRVLIWLWITSTGWAIGLWIWLGGLTALINWLTMQGALLIAWTGEIFSLALSAFTVVGRLIMELGTLMMALLGLLNWIGVLVLTMLLLILDAMSVSVCWHPPTLKSVLRVP